MQGINFRPNIKGTGQPGNVGIISGTIVLEEDTASGFIITLISLFIIPFILTTVLSDISNFSPVTVSQETNAALNIQIIPQSDTISLELDDSINLRFNPSNMALTPEAYLAETGEFLRDVTFVRIMDDDSECCVFLASIKYINVYTS